MRKFIVCASAVCLILSLAAVPAAAKKAGDIADDVYTDADFGFSFKVPTGWGADVKQSKLALRVTMTQKSYPVPQQFQGGGEDYATIPTINVLADTTSMTAGDFLKFLLDPKAKSEQKKFFLQKLAIISKPHDVIKNKDITLADNAAKLLEIKQQYTTEVAERESDKSNVVTNFKGGSLFVTVRGGKVIILHAIFEYAYNGQYQDIFGALVSSLTFQ